MFRAKHQLTCVLLACCHFEGEGFPVAARNTNSCYHPTLSVVFESLRALRAAIALLRGCLKACFKFVEFFSKRSKIAHVQRILSLLITAIVSKVRLLKFFHAVQLSLA